MAKIESGVVVNFGKVQMLNLVGAESIKNLIGQELVVKGFMIGQTTDELEGETKTFDVAYMDTDLGMVNTISDTAIQTLEQLEDFGAEMQAGKISVIATERTSGKGRKFVILTVKVK